MKVGDELKDILIGKGMLPSKEINWFDAILWVFTNESEVKELHFWYQTFVHELFYKCKGCPAPCDIAQKIENCNESSGDLLQKKLIYECFSGMFVDWFKENTDYHLLVDCVASDYNYWSLIPQKGMNLISSQDDNEYFKTIQLARHEGILRIFNLLINATD